MSDLVSVWIMGDEYECPEHYHWSEGPLGNGHDSYCAYEYQVPREQLERWKKVQEDFLAMNQEMKEIQRQPARRESKGLPW